VDELLLDVKSGRLDRRVEPGEHGDVGVRGENAQQDEPGDLAVAPRPKRCR
jgi:hypothetical protein